MQLYYQTLNANDWDPAVSGVALFNDLGGTPRAVVVDKAGFGYLLTQGQLCGSGFTLDTACVGFASGDPGSWTFGAAKTFCTSNPGTCDRVTSMAVYDNYINHTPGSGHAVHTIYWPNNERLTEIQVSDNSTAVSGVSGQSLTWTSGSSTTLNLASCTADVNCLGDQVVPGDTLALTGTGCSCTGGTCPTVTKVTDSGTSSSLTINTTVSAGYGTSCTSGSGFTYTGWLVTPAHDSTPGVSVGGYPGGAVMLSANCTGLPSTACYHGLIWAILPGSDSTNDTLNRGLGTLYAYTALPNSNDILSKDYNSSDTWCGSSFARPTIVNASAFVPTYATSCPSGTSGCSRTQTFTNCKSSGTGSIGDGNGPYPSGVLRYN